MKLNACGTSDVGLVRSTNEDSWFVSTADGLFMVADGMGGHAAGEVASDLAVRAVRERLRPARPDSPASADPGALLAGAVRSEERRVGKEC